MEHNRIATWWLTWEDLNWPDHDNMDKIKARAEGLAKQGEVLRPIFEECLENEITLEFITEPIVNGAVELARCNAKTGSSCISGASPCPVLPTSTI